MSTVLSPTHVSSSPTIKTVIQVKLMPLTGAESAKRLECELEPAYVKQTLNVLHITEFLVLAEYTKVIIPIVYSAYCILSMPLLLLWCTTDV